MFTIWDTLIKYEIPASSIWVGQQECMAEFIAEQVIHLGEETNEKRGETPVSRQDKTKSLNKCFVENYLKLGVVVGAFNLSTQEAETGFL